jgi:hypothetical protein
MFPGFTDEDFDAYEPAKWKSNVFTRQRQEVKQKLMLLGRDLGGSLRAADASPLACEASVEYPALWNHKQVEAQHLFFSRSAEARKEIDGIIDRARSIASLVDDPTPQRNHLFLSVSLDYRQLEVALKLHPDARVDRQNLERKCEDYFAREKLCSLTRGLGAGFLLSVTGLPAVEVTTLDDTGLTAALAGLAATGHHWFAIGRAIPRTDPAARAPSFGEVARSWLLSLLPIYHYIAWSRENDYVSMRETLQKERQVKRQRGLAKSDRVRIVRGVLAGKVGVVQDCDAKGGIRILVGKMSVKVDADDLVKQ